MLKLFILLKNSLLLLLLLLLLFIIIVSIYLLAYDHSNLFFKAFPFQIEVFTRKGDSALEAEKMDSGGKKLETCLMNSIKTTSAQRPFKDNKNIVLYKSENGARTTLAVENKVLNNDLFHFDN